MTVTFKEYEEELIKFAQKHNKKAECKIWTSPMENNRYYKTRTWSDGACFDEVTELITEEVEVEAHGIKTKVAVRFWRTEFWSTEQPSKYIYSRA